MPSESIRPAKLADTVAEHFERLILEGALRPGERLLPERELAARLDISRPSLRDAITKLVERGLLTTTASGGTMVCEGLGATLKDPLVELFQTHPEATFDYLEFRNVTEGSAAAFAALRATDIDRQEIRSSFERMAASHDKDDPTEEADADADFHLAIYEASHNLFMLHVMRSLSGMLRNDVFYNRATLYLRRNVRDLLLAQHRAIRDAIMAGDAEAARQAAREHMSFTADALKEIAKADARLEVSLNRIARNDALTVSR